ncbi:MAG: hypothetical protein ACREDR_04010 [Blastocatellia bacterium]
MGLGFIAERTGIILDVDFEQVARRVIELSGGKERLSREIQAKLEQVNEKWNRDHR